MLKEGGSSIILELLGQDAKTHRAVLDYANRILGIMHDNGFLEEEEAMKFERLRGEDSTESTTDRDEILSSS